VTAHLRSGKRLPRPCADQRALLLGQSGKEVQNERINVWPKLCDQERHLVRHEAAHEVHIAAKAVQFRHRDVTPEFPSSGEGGFKLGTAVQRVGAFASLYLDKLPGHGEALGLCEVLKRLPLGLDAQTRAPLLGRGYANVGDQGTVGGHRKPDFEGMGMIDNPLMAYIRVSTSQQGRSGLGIEAQRESLRHFVRQGASSIKSAKRVYAYPARYRSHSVATPILVRVFKPTDILHLIFLKTHPLRGARSDVRAPVAAH
jgi:hypothetical protein